MEKKILYVNWGGLGDHLQFTTLPEIFTNLGHEFYISDKSMFRSQEIYDLVWKTNPYCKGITSENANCGHLDNWGVNNPVVFDKTISMHQNIEKLYGVNSNYNYPKIYNTPKNLPEYNDYIVLDLNAFSVADYSHNIEVIMNYIETLRGKKVIYVLSESSYGRSIIDISYLNDYNFESIKTENIFNYVNLIYSCKKFVSFWSGGSHLAAAIKSMYKNELEIDCLKVSILTPSDWGITDKSFFWYDNVNYIIC